MIEDIFEIIQKYPNDRDMLEACLKMVKGNISAWYSIKDLIEKKLGIGGANNAQTQTF